MYGCPDFSENAWEAALGLFDFTLCQRPNGSFYGTSGHCRKGVEAEHEEEVTRDHILSGKTFEHLKLKKRETANKFLNALSDEEFANVTNLAAQMITTKPTPKVGVMTPAAVKALGGRASLLQRAEKDPKVLLSDLKEVSQKEVDALWSILTPQLQAKTSNPNIVNGMIKGSGVTKDQARKQLLKRWMQQDGKDLITGLPLNFIEAELDHIRSFDDLRESAHSINNLGWIQRDVNQQKLNSPLGAFAMKAKNTTAEEAKKKYDEAISRTNQKGDLKVRVKEDIRLLKGQADKFIAEYGKYSYYFLRESGFVVTIQQPGATRPRGLGWTRKIKEDNGNRESIENVIIRKLPEWSPSQLETARQIVRTYTQKMENEEVSIPQGNQLIYREIQRIQTNTGSFSRPSQSPSKAIETPDKLDALLKSIRNS